MKSTTCKSTRKDIPALTRDVVTPGTLRIWKNDSTSVILLMTRDVGQYGPLMSAVVVNSEVIDPDTSARRESPLNAVGLIWVARSVMDWLTITEPYYGSIVLSQSAND